MNFPIGDELLEPQAKRPKLESGESGGQSVCVVNEQHSVAAVLETPMVGSSCVFCQRELKRPWELVGHMVDDHNVQIATIECGRQLQKSMAPQSGCFCLLCEEIFSSTHLLYYHILQQHVKAVFGRESHSDFCVIEMITTEKRQLTLKVRIKRKDLGKQPVNASNLGISLPTGMTVVAVDGVTQSGAFATESGTPQSSPMKSSTGQVSNDHSDIPSCSSSTQDSSSKPVGLDDEYFFPGAIKDANSLDWGLSNVDGQSKQLKRPDGSLKRVRPSAANDIIVLDLPQNLIDEAEKKLRIHHRGFQCAVCFKTRETRELAIAHIYRLHLSTVQRRFTCKICGKSYDNEKNLRVHNDAVHGEGRQYQCPGCPMRYKYPGDLKRHMSRNVCEKFREAGYSCIKCGLTWYHPSALASHQRQCDGI